MTINTPVKKSIDTKYILLRSPVLIDSEDEGVDDGNVVEFYSCPNVLLNGQYIRSDEDINGFPHYEKVSFIDSIVEVFHLFWSGTQWVIHKVMY